jgi:predicted DsbA family dithiol-disulfide isomerase
VPVTLRLYTDFVCPFCFIAEQSTVPRLLSELDLELEWHGFELHPGTPRGGRPLSSLFPGADLPSLHERTRRFGARFGVAHFDPPDMLRNSRRALAIAELARDRGRLPAWRAAAFEAHWRQGKNLEDDADLRALAASVDLDPDEAIAAADDPALLARVDARQDEARATGIRGVPTFIFDPGQGHTATAVVGCQPYEALADAARRAGAKPR